MVCWCVDGKRTGWEMIRVLDQDQRWKGMRTVIVAQ